MKILLVNKFLYPAGGAEKYIISLGNQLKLDGNVVEFFGLEDNRTVGNSYNIYAKFSKNPISIVYSKYNKKQMLKLIDYFKPDIVHFNNINFQLSTSIIDSCKEKNVPVVMTVHDPQLVCPNHMFYLPNGERCTECLDGNFKHCVEKRCLKNSFANSYLAYIESKFTHKSNKYDYISKFICPSDFIKEKLICGGFDKNKTTLLRNFYELYDDSNASYFRKDYYLYYGRVSKEKGIELLIKQFPKELHLIVAGSGPLLEELKSKCGNNVEFVGFKTGIELTKLIKEAKATIYPSIWYENCPLSVIESISYGTPVIGTNLGGITELISDGKTGLLFGLENDDLSKKINEFDDNKELQESMYMACGVKQFMDAKEYTNKLIKIYEEVIENAKNSK